MPVKVHDETSPLLRPVSPVPISRDGSLNSNNDRDSKPSPTPTLLQFKIAAAMYSFIVLGLFTSAIGVMLPRISEHYNLNDLQVSYIFLVNPIGYILASQSNSAMHCWFGQRGIAIVSPILHIISAVMIAVHPPFPVLLLGFAVMNFGSGFLDGSWCAWAGSMNRANLVSGLLHGSFSAGAAAGPFFAGLWMGEGTNWWEWYYFLTAFSVLEFIILLAAFRHENADRYHNSKVYTELARPPTLKAASREMLRYPALWISSAYFLTYVGNETAISGWIVTYMLRARHASTKLSDRSSSCFWAGMATGRLLLGYFTDLIGVRRATGLYLLCAIILQITFILVQQNLVLVIIMALLGFFMGPLFPSGIVVLTRLLPKELHVAAVSLVASLGQVGGAALPFAIGALVHDHGIGVFRWVILIFTSVSLLIWIAFARLGRKSAVVMVGDR